MMNRKNLKNFLNILFVCVMSMLLLVGCGGKKEQTSLVKDIEAENIEKDDERSESTDKDDTETVESNLAEDLSDKDEDSIEKEITYIEKNDIYLLSNACNDGIQIDLSSFEFESKQYTLKKSVDIYYTDGTLAGYTKENASVYVISGNDEWSFCSFDTDGFLIKKSELTDAILVEDEKVDNLVKQPEAQEPIHSDATVKSDTTANVPNEAAKEPTVENPISAESDKYTPEEAIAVYRSLMEAGGITWDPSLKGVTSWGTGWIYLDKGQPEWCASTDLESFAMGDSGGRAWTKYYLEVTGSDENAVYITEWSSN